MKKAISRDSRFHIFVAMQMVWISMLVTLALWWGSLLVDQAKEISTLREALGLPLAQTLQQVSKIERMIFYESGSFIVLLLVANAILIYLFSRDHKRSKSIQIFFASLTHETKTPLTSIRLQAEALQDIEDDPRHTPYVKRLLEDVSRLEGQLSQSLELARLEGGGKINAAPISFSPYFQKNVLQSPLAQSGKVEVRLLNEIPNLTIYADLSALQIVFRNLFDNATRYSTELPAKIEISLASSPTQNQLLLIFEHTNSINNETKEFTGELFVRGAQSLGAGVGLFLTKTLMDKMGGSARFEGKPHKFITQLKLVTLEDDHV